VSEFTVKAPEDSCLKPPDDAETMFPRKHHTTIARGPVHYEYVLAAIDRRIRKITFFITSERNTSTVGGSHVLCMFIDNHHANFGASDHWADLDKFHAAAVKLIEKVIAREHNQPDDPPVNPTLLPPSNTP